MHHQPTPPDRHAQWRSTVDYILTGRWPELLDALDATTPELVVSAVCFGLDYSPHNAKPKAGYLDTEGARRIMTALQVWEPRERLAVIRSLHAPSPCRQESGKVHWPINSSRTNEPGDNAWGRIFGIEAAWMQHDGAGFLMWTELGRARYLTGDDLFFTESTGQAAFAF